MAIAALGALLILPGSQNPSEWKPAVMAVGLGLWAFTVKPPRQINLQVLLVWGYLLFLLLGRGNHPRVAWEMGLTLACAFAFYLGWSQIRLPRLALSLVVWASIVWAVIDLLSLPLLSAWFSAHDAVASFFQNRHAFAGLMLVAAFAHFYLIEKASPHLSVWLWTSTLGVLIALLLSDSRSAQGIFFVLFFPMVFLSLRLDFREPHPERLVWVAGITLCVGMVWLNLPDRQLHAAARVFTEDPGEVWQERQAAWLGFSASPWLGHGSGSYPWVARSFLPRLAEGGVNPSVTDDSLWNQLDPGLDQAVTFADMTLNAQSLPTAESHPLQILAEKGLIGLGMELAILALALFGLFRNTLKQGHAHTRFAGFALAGLYAHGLFTPALESAPLRVLLFGLLGFGASLWPGKSLHPTPKPGYRALPLAWMIRGLAFFLLSYALSLCYQVWKSESAFREALKHTGDPRRFTEEVTRSLLVFPRHVEANYAYAQILASFNQQDEALKRLDHLSRFAPDPPRQDLARASVLATTGNPEEAAAVLAPWLHRRHPPLAALEMSLDMYAQTGNCRAMGRLQADSSRFLREYPRPDPEKFTAAALQREFLAGEEVNFLQLWFGGRTLRQRYMNKRLEAYHAMLNAHERVLKALRRTCEDDSDIPAGKRHRHSRPAG